MNKKRLISLVLMTIVLFSLVPCYHLKSVKADSKIVYVALGDSIAAGYGLSGYSDETNAKAPKKSYQRLVGSKLNATVKNHAVTGLTSEGLLEQLKSGDLDEDLSKAKIISVSIGSNDLLSIFEQIIGDTLGITADSGEEIITKSMDLLKSSDMIQIIAYLSDIQKQVEDNSEMLAAAKNFTNQFSEIISVLKEKAPDAHIYVTNCYNPFVGITNELFPLGTYTASYVKELNQAFEADSEDYSLVDVYEAFQTEEYVNANISLDLSSLKLDPHPNIAGHAKIAKLVLAAIKKDYKPDKTKISKLKSKSCNSITIKLKTVENCEGYEIRYSATKNGEYKALATTDETSTTIENIKLESGNTFYLKVYTYNKVGDLTVYGTGSTAKKITIFSEA